MECVVIYLLLGPEFSNFHTIDILKSMIAMIAKKSLKILFISRFRSRFV